jgi:dihydropteroate synthase
MELKLRDKSIVLDRTLIMGILNVTPDSFSDGGMFKDADAAIKRAHEMVNEGADIIDIGGESTRPGAETVSEEEELKRVIPVIEGFRKADIITPLSVDTYKSRVAGRALAAGADIVNDISGGTFDGRNIMTAAEYGAAYVIMHIKGTPKNMQEDPVYSKRGVVADLKEFFKERIQAALAGGIKKESIIIDPGIGFGKTLNDNFKIIDGIPELLELGYPVLIGTSRKSMIGKVLNAGPDSRLFGTAATVALSIAKGASIVRVHDVKEIKDVARMSDAMLHFREMEAVK